MTDTDNADDEPAADPVGDDPTVELRRSLVAIAAGRVLRPQLLAVINPRSGPQLFEVPIDLQLARDLVDMCREMAQGAAEAELREQIAGFTPSEHQWVYTTIPTGPLTDIEAQVPLPTHPQLVGSTRLGGKNVLVMRLIDEEGVDVAHFYQGLSSERALQRAHRKVAIFQNGQFRKLETRPLLLDSAMRVAVIGDLLVARRGKEFEQLFGPLPGTTEQASAHLPKRSEVLISRVASFSRQPAPPR